MYGSLEEVRQAVDANDGVISIEMRQLRDAYGAGKLGIHVLGGIAQQLTDLGLRTIPHDLPNSANDYIRIFHKNGATHKLLIAIITPGEDGDELLRRTVRRMSSWKDAETLSVIWDILVAHRDDDVPNAVIGS